MYTMENNTNTHIGKEHRDLNNINYDLTSRAKYTARASHCVKTQNKINFVASLLLYCQLSVRSFQVSIRH